MDKRTEQAFAYLEKNEHSMMELLKNLVSIETPSADREANERIAAHLDTYCDALGMERQIHHFEKAGPTFAAWTRPQEKKPILLLGHMDTVHAVGKFGPEPFLVKDDRVYGPGVYDMKGGDVIALFVLRALNDDFGCPVLWGVRPAFRPGGDVRVRDNVRRHGCAA